MTIVENESDYVPIIEDTKPVIEKEIIESQPSGALYFIIGICITIIIVIAILVICQYNKNQKIKKLVGCVSCKNMKSAENQKFNEMLYKPYEKATIKQYSPTVERLMREVDLTKNKYRFPSD